MAHREWAKHFLDAARLEDVVGAEELDVAATGERERPVEVPVDPEILGVRIEADARVRDARTRATVPSVGGVVDDHDLEVAMRLLECRADRALDPASASYAGMQTDTSGAALIG